jgi:signal transduction histidine kinase
VRRPRSLASTLTIRLTLALVGWVVVVAAIALWSARARIDEIYDAQLIAGTKLLHALVKEHLEHHTGEVPSEVLRGEDVDSFRTYAEWRAFRIWKGSRIVAQTPRSPDQLVVPAREGFVDFAVPPNPWRGYRLFAEDLGLFIAVAEPLSQRDAVVDRFAWALVWPSLLLIPVGAGLMWLTLLDGLSTLRRLSAELNTRSGANLALLNPQRWPSDLGATVTAVNGLLERLDRSLHQARRFTDHAAHQLRTPFAGLKINAQLLETEKSEEQRAALAGRIREGAERGGALVEQLLTLARLDSAAVQLVPLDVEQIARSVLGEFAGVAAAQQVSLALAAQQPAVAMGDALLLKMILGNLIDNAIKHSPAGREVMVEASRDGGWVLLSVTDEGSGIPAADRGRVFERFYQRDSDKPGVGLGLSIVAEAVSQIGGSVTLDTASSGTGLRAVIRLRAAQS